MSVGEIRAPQGCEPRDCDVLVVAMIPFLTGRWHDSSTAPLLAEGRRVELPDALDDATSTRAAAYALEQVLSDVKLWGYSDKVKQQIRRNLPHRTHRVEPPTAALPALPPVGGANWIGSMFTVDFWDVGVGLAMLAYQLSAAETSWTEVRQSIASDGTKAVLLDGTTRAVTAMTGEDDTSALFGNETHFAAPGSALWVQELLVVEVGERVSGDCLDEIARFLTRDGGRLEPRTKSADEVMWLGVEACWVRNPDAPDTAGALARVLSTQTAVWAAVMELDHLLSVRLRAAGSESGTTLQQLDERQHELLRVYESVRRFRADADVMPLHLDVRDRELWTAIDREWPLGDQLSALDTRLAAVEHVYRHLTDARAAEFARRINGIVLAITFVSFAAFMLAAYEFLRTPVEPISWPHSVAVLVVVIAITIGVYFAFQRWARDAWQRGRAQSSRPR